jgi:hypothetical protein
MQKIVNLQKKFGSFYASAQWLKMKFTHLENELLKINISNKGGRITSVILKKF